MTQVIYNSYCSIVDMFFIVVNPTIPPLVTYRAEPGLGHEHSGCQGVRPRHKSDSRSRRAHFT